MKITDKRRFSCVDCNGSLFYRRLPNGRITASHDIGAGGQPIAAVPNRLPHTKRTLDRARREARCFKQVQP